MVIRHFNSVWSLIGLMWIVFVLSLFFPLQAFGIHPRHVYGLVGIPLGPFLHADVLHLVMNSIGILSFGFLFFALEGRHSSSAIWFMIWVQGILVWLFARDGNHIGASGVVFGMFGYLATIGLFRRRFINIMISVVVLLLYGGMLFGVLPQMKQVSWEAHLCGFVAGVLAAKAK